jgi:hypothetical protein
MNVIDNQTTTCVGRLLETEAPCQKKEIEAIFSRQRISNNLIHGLRSRSVSSLGHNTDCIIIQTLPVAKLPEYVDPASNSSLLFPQSSLMKDKNINLYTKLFSSSNNGKVATLPEELGHRILWSGDNRSSMKQINSVANDESMNSLYDPISEFNSQKIKCKNIDIRLAREIGITNYNRMSDIGEPEEWVPPEKHGLENSERIIPTYYIPSNMNKSNVLRVDYHYMILDDIRNVRPLNKYQLNYINNSLSESEKYKIIEEFNNVIMSYGEVLLNDQ